MPSSLRLLIAPAGHDKQGGFSQWWHASVKNGPLGSYSKLLARRRENPGEESFTDWQAVWQL